MLSRTTEAKILLPRRVTANNANNISLFLQVVQVREESQMEGQE